MLLHVGRLVGGVVGVAWFEYKEGNYGMNSHKMACSSNPPWQVQRQTGGAGPVGQFLALGVAHVLPFTGQFLVARFPC